MPLIDLNGLGHFKAKENAMVADAYSASKTYAVGDYVYYNGTLYRCTTAISTAEAWTAGHWTAAKLGDDCSALKTAIKDDTVLKTAVIAFDQGGLSDSSGSSTSANNRIRTHSYLPSNIIGVKVPTGKRVWVYAFLNNVYQGRYVGNHTISKSTASGVSTRSVYDFLFVDLSNTQYDYKIVVSNTDNSNISSSTGGNDLQYYYHTDETLTLLGKSADAKATGEAIKDVELQITGAQSEITEIVNPSMTRTQFVTACDAKWSDFAELCLCSDYSFNVLNGTSTFEEAYERLNSNFREDVYIEGMTKNKICDRINRAFAKPIKRFEDARLNLDTVCDFSIKFEDRSGEPSLVVSADGGELWVYAYGNRFKTDDGTKWTKEAITLSDNGTFGHAGYSVIDDTIYLIARDYANNNDLKMYTSPLSDGLEFTYRGVVLDKGHDFGDGLSITNWGNSCMTKINDTFYLFIEGKDADNRNFWDTYLVTCSDPLEAQVGGTIGDWTNSSVNPIIAGSTIHPTSTSNVAVGNPDFAKGSDNRPIRIDGRWFLYIHTTAFSYSYVNRISSPDLVHWTYDGRMFDNRNKPTVGQSQSSNADQAIIEFKGRTYFFYTTDINTELTPHLAYMVDDRPIREILAMRP